jgi:hypothetical protein
VQAAPATAQAVPAADEDRGAEAVPRAVLRHVRQMVNEFRADQWDGLVRMRNQLWQTMGYTALIVFGTLALAVLAHVTSSELIAACAFYLVGATIGLFSRLYIQSQQKFAVDDKGLATARLFLAPMLSGIAGVGGVLATAMLSSAMLAIGLLTSTSTSTLRASGTPVVTPVAAAVSLRPAGPPIVLAASTAASPPAGNTIPVRQETAQDVQQPARLEDIFNLEKYPVGLAVAAVFGVTPGLLLQGLQQQSNQYKTDLKKSQATQRRAS